MSGEAITRREILGGVAALGLTAGCLGPFSPSYNAVLVDDASAFEIVDVSDGGLIAAADVVIRISSDWVDQLDYVVQMKDGQQETYRSVGTGETTFSLFIAPGTATLLGISGGRTQDGKVVDGEIAVREEIEVTKS